jgi:hypothetical protein
MVIFTYYANGPYATLRDMSHVYRLVRKRNHPFLEILKKINILYYQIVA